MINIFEDVEENYHYNRTLQRRGQLVCKKLLPYQLGQLQPSPHIFGKDHENDALQPLAEEKQIIC